MARWYDRCLEHAEWKTLFNDKNALKTVEIKAMEKKNDDVILNGRNEPPGVMNSKAAWTVAAPKKKEFQNHIVCHGHTSYLSILGHHHTI